MGDLSEYDDIIDVEYGGVEGRPRMSLRDRAAQCAPFAALTGFEDIIEQTTLTRDSQD